MDEEAVEPQAEVIEQIIEDVQSDEVAQDDNDQVERQDKKMVPLSALQKLREKKRELELELQWERQRNMQQIAVPKPPEDDSSRYESATKEDLNRSQEEAIRAIEEKLWIKNNPEIYKEVIEDLPKFLEKRPHLALSINAVSNRYEEAYKLMSALSPKQQQQLKKNVTPAKKEAPNAPGSVPKATAINEAVDVMSMSDSEFTAWRNSKKKRR